MTGWVMQRTTMAHKDTVCLWYDGAALEAARFYAETFPRSNVGAVTNCASNLWLATGI